MKLLNVLKINNLGTTKHCHKLIINGLITINNKVIYNNVEVSNNDRIMYQNKLLENNYKYIMINKPKGYICSNSDKNNKCLDSLIDDKGLSYVGRLDKDTTGLVLMTNDNYLRNHLLLPNFHKDKKYLFNCLKPLSNQDIKTISEGIVLNNGYKCLEANIELHSPSSGVITIYEGKYHQIKRMFQAINNKITSLHRLSISSLKLSDLKEGNYRHLTTKEIEDLYKKISR
ncbi:MAG: pseudouridine synthase [Thomasclavelia sp.]|nr:pseudouridine synthase [Thomasclavelia sp.]